MTDIKVGKITHYFDKIGVAVVEILKPIKVGDLIKISGHDQEFNQTITSMQVEHDQVETVKKGQSVGLKVDKQVKEGDEVYLVS